jgi:pimeloyl-ACP methyl ester carboxylesterase
MGRHPSLWSYGCRPGGMAPSGELWPCSAVRSRVTSQPDRPRRRRHMIEPLELPARGLAFDALAAGPPTGELVVLLHGFPRPPPAGHCYWRPLRQLGIVRWRPTSTATPPPPGPPPSGLPPGRAGRRRVAIADRLDAETFHLVGHDWGGVVAWRLAGQQPERVATLTAVSTPHPRASARALLAGTQGLRSAYIPGVPHPSAARAAAGRPPAVGAAPAAGPGRAGRRLG